MADLPISQEFNAAGFNMLSNILAQVTNEVLAQDEKWGVQDYNNAVWALILDEKFGKAWQAALQHSPGTDKNDVRAEIVQIAAVAVNWIACIDRRKATKEDTS